MSSDQRGSTEPAHTHEPALLTPVLVDFPPRPGVKDVSLGRADLAAKSAEALDAAMASIRSMADRVTAAVASAAERPDEVSVEFGLKLDAAAGALLARAGTEAHVTVTMTW